MIMVKRIGLIMMMEVLIIILRLRLLRQNQGYYTSKIIVRHFMLLDLVGVGIIMMV